MVTLEMFGIAMAAMFAPAEATTVATSDSQASVKAIEAETSRVAPLAALLRVCEHGVNTVQHIAGLDNWLADGLSREGELQLPGCVPVNAPRAIDLVSERGVNLYNIQSE